MYCKKCGKQIPDDSVFCQFCGTQVGMIREDSSKPLEEVYESNTIQEEPEEESFAQVSVEYGESVETSNPKKGFIVIGIILAAMLVVGCLTNGIAMIKNKDKKEDIVEEVIDEEIEEKKEEVEQKPEKVEKKVTQPTPEPVPEPEPEPETVQVASPDYIIPDSSSRYISESELYGLSADECCFARNEIYARHHRLFQTDYIQAYFYTKSWYDGYIAPEAFTADMLNEIETVNVATILNYERAMGWQ